MTGYTIKGLDSEGKPLLHLLHTEAVEEHWDENLHGWQIDLTKLDKKVKSVLFTYEHCSIV